MMLSLSRMVFLIRTLTAIAIIYGIILCFEYEMYAVVVSFIFLTLYIQLREINLSFKLTLSKPEESCGGDCLNCICK
jgi:hypothetical protein